VEGPRTLEETQAVAREVEGPLLYNVTPTGSVPPLDAAALEAIGGYRLLSCSVFALLAAIPGMRGFLRAMRETGDPAKAGAGAASMAEYLEILRFAEWQEMEGRYTPKP
jgi:2-methylisocitrate lyase-like PEP mutase family enzyme